MNKISEDEILEFLNEQLNKSGLFSIVRDMFNKNRYTVIHKDTGCEFATIYRDKTIEAMEWLRKES